MRKRPANRAVWVLLPLLTSLVPVSPAPAAPALFWISTDGTNPDVPGVAEFTAAAGVPRQLHIWAQPRTAAAGDWHATTNPFLEFQNVSLNVVSPQTTFDIDPTSITVHNPTYSTGEDRFGDVNDSSTGLTESTGAEPGPFDDLPPGFSKGLLDLQGYSVPASDGAGFGVDCDSNDNFCATTTSGAPAWLFASFDVTPTASTGSIEFSIQVGRNGMNHVGESSSAMLVEFGVDTVGLSPADYNPDVDRSITFAEDDRDAVLSLAGAGDYNADGAVDALDYAVWMLQFDSSNYDADGNGDGTVGIADYNVWRDNLTTSPSPLATFASSSTSKVPEPRSVMLAAVALLWSLRRGRLSLCYHDWKEQEQTVAAECAPASPRNSLSSGWLATARRIRFFLRGEDRVFLEQCEFAKMIARKEMINSVFSVVSCSNFGPSCTKLQRNERTVAVLASQSVRSRYAAQ